MKIDTDRAHMKDAAAIVARATSKRPTLPVLAGILIEAHPEGRVSLSATDLDHAVEALVPADVAETGRALIPAKALADIVKSGADRLTFAMHDDGTAVDVTGDGATMTVRTLPIEDWPALPDRLAGRSDGVTLTGADMDVLARVRTAAGTEQDRPVLTGVYFDPKTGQAAATDSYTLHVGEMTDADGVARALGGALVPARILRDVGRWKLDGRTVRAYAQRDQVAPSGNANTDRRPTAVELVGVHVAGPKTARRETVVHVHARTIEGTFPNHAALWPEDVGETIALDGDELVDAADQVRRFAAGRRNLPTTVTVDSGRLWLNVSAPELGDMSAPVSITGTVPETFPSIAFNPDLLHRCALAVGTEVALAVRGPLKPAVLAGNDRVRALLMPMRIN